jgi:hypothetical protein
MNRKLLALGTSILSPVIAGLPVILAPSAVAVLFLLPFGFVAGIPGLLIFGDEAALVFLAANVLARGFGLDAQTAGLVAL